MLALQRSPSRKGLTLIELLIVIALMATLATLVALYVLPSFQDNKNVVRGVDRVTTTLLIAKQRALRDHTPRGVRFLTPGGSLQVTQLAYIELPATYVGSPAPNASTFSSTSGSPTVTFQNVDFQGGADTNNFDEYQVQPGDYFRDLNGPQPYQISGVSASPAQLTLFTPSSQTWTNSTKFEIVRQPRQITGESLITLPNNVIVDLALVPATNQVPLRTLPVAGGASYYEILFDPSGGTTSLGSSNSSAMILLLIRDATAATAPALDPNLGRILAINPRTGFIAAHPIAPGGNPFAFALDGKSSGL
jgi:prepilin-type N-terminal cleavage/methylation domain-containing protein